MPDRPGPTLTDEIELASPYGVLKTIYGDVKNGARGKIVSPLTETPLRVKFAGLSESVTVPAHWAKTIVR